MERLHKTGETTAEKKELQLKEVRIEFDRYLRKFVADGRHRRGKRTKEIHDEKIADFKQKWADYLVEEHNADDDIRPMLGLDAYDPVAKPYKQHGNFAV